MLFESLRQHTGGKGWWTAFEEWQEAWNICRDTLRELRREADEVVGNHINEKPSFKEEVERQISKGRDEVRSIAKDMLWVVWEAEISGTPVEKFEFRAEERRVVACFGDGTHFPFTHSLGEVSLGPDLEEVCDLAYESLRQSFSAKHIPEIFHRMDEKIEEIDDALDPFILRPLLVRTRCKLCPV